MSISIYLSYSNKIGQSYRFGSVSLKYTLPNRAEITSSDTSAGKVNIAKKWAGYLPQQRETTTLTRFHEMVDRFLKAPEDQSLNIVEPSMIGVDPNETVDGRMSTWLKGNESAGLVEKDGRVKEFNGLVTQDGGIYRRLLREEYANGGSVSMIAEPDAENPVKLALPVSTGEPQQVQIHVLMEAEAAEKDAQLYDMQHYSMKESFLMDMGNGYIQSSLAGSGDGEDALKSIETFSLQAGRYQALLKEFCGSDANYAELQDQLNGMIAQSAQTISGKIADDFAGFFTQNGVDFDQAAMAETVGGIIEDRLADYQSAYQKGDITVQNTGNSILAYMSSQKNDQISVANGQFGEISYQDIAHLSDAVYEFENTFMGLADGGRLFGGDTAEQIGMTLGLAQAQVRIMDDGSSIFGAFRKAAGNQINAMIDSAVEESQTKSENYSSEGYGLVYKPMSRSDITGLMSWFDNIEYGNVQTNLQYAMSKVKNRYMSAAPNDANYVGSFSPNNKHLSFMPNEFWQDMADNMVDTRNEAVTNAEDFMLLNWNMWLGSSGVVQDGGKYMASPQNSAVDVRA